MDSPLFVPISREEFASLNLFRGVSYDLMVGYLDNAEVVEYEEDMVLISPNEDNTILFVVLEGLLDVHLETPDGLVVRTLGKGDCAGEMSLFDMSRPSAWVSSRDTTRVLQMSKEVVLALLRASHEFCLNLLVLLSDRLRSSSTAISHDMERIRRIEAFASVDALTGLHNRRWMTEMFPRELNRSEMGNQPLVAMMVDIDHFKKVNDTHGHLAGDAVLAVVARSIGTSLRPSDMLVRYGGEEFCILLPNTPGDVALTVGERIRLAVQARIIDLPDGGHLKVTISLGASAHKKGDTLETLLQRADRALYQAKEEGRNRCKVG